MTARDMPKDPVHKRRYEVVSDRCVWGAPGDVVELELTEGQELSLLQAGTVKRAKVRPTVAAKKG